MTALESRARFGKTKRMTNIQTERHQHRQREEEADREGQTDGSRVSVVEQHGGGGVVQGLTGQIKEQE